MKCKHCLRTFRLDKEFRELNALWSHLELDGRPQMWQIKSLLANIVSVDKNVQEIEKNEIAIG